MPSGVRRRVLSCIKVLPFTLFPQGHGGGSPHFPAVPPLTCARPERTLRSSGTGGGDECARKTSPSHKPRQRGALLHTGSICGHLVSPPWFPSVSGSQDRRSPWPSSARCMITWISSHGKGAGEGGRGQRPARPETLHTLRALAVRPPVSGVETTWRRSRRNSRPRDAVGKIATQPVSGTLGKKQHF